MTQTGLEIAAPDTITDHPAVNRVRAALAAHGVDRRVTILDGSARTAAQAAQQLGVDVGQIANSLVFRLGPATSTEPLLILTSGRHRVDTTMVAGLLAVEGVHRADADLVRAATGFTIGGVSPVAHPAPLRTLVDAALADYEVVWAAAGHPHAVFPTTYDELLRITGGTAAVVSGQ